MKFFSLFFSIILVSNLYGTQYYVRTDGSDLNLGTSNTSGGAWLTVQKAANSATTAGDIVTVQAGTYNESILRNNKGDGAAGNPITFNTNGTVVIKGFEVRSDPYITISGFEVTNSTPLASMNTGAIEFRASDNCIVENCYIHDIRGVGIFGYYDIGLKSDNVIVRYNLVTGCQVGLKVYGDSLANGGSGWLVEYNTFTDPTDWSSSGGGSLPVTDCDYTRIYSGQGHIFQYNKIYGAQEDHVFALGTHTGSNGATTLSTNSYSTRMSRCLDSSDLNGKAIKNYTSGASGTIGTYTPGATATLTTSMSGGTRTTWNAGDVFAVSVPDQAHMDGIQMFNTAYNYDSPIQNITIRYNYFADFCNGLFIENQSVTPAGGGATVAGQNGPFIITGNVFGPSAATTWVEHNWSPFQFNINGSESVLNGTNLITANTFCKTTGSLYLYHQVTTIKNNIFYYTGNSVFVVDGSSTLTKSYNIYYPTTPSSPGTNYTNSDPGFVYSAPTTVAHVLGADGLFLTADDGLRLTSGSLIRGLGESGVDPGAYQFTANFPTINITAPSTGSTYTTNDNINFTGAASDAEDGTISSNIIWTSNLDGSLGTGASIFHTLTSGSHIITASITDSNSHVTTANITLNINSVSSIINRAKTRGKTAKGVMAK